MNSLLGYSEADDIEFDEERVYFVEK